MATTYKYVNNITNKKIDDNTFLFSNNQGVFETMGQGNALKFTPRDYIDVRIDDTEDGYEKADMPLLPDAVDTVPYNTSITDQPCDYITARKYLFGIDSIDINKSIPAKINGFVSKAIKISNCSYIELAVKTSNKTNIEYSILEGLKETPILPVDQTEVSHEKLFYGLELRFTPDESKPIKIYRNGQETSYKYHQLKTIPFEDGEYTISYTPLKTSHQYYPASEEIKIKAVQRHREGDIPASIQSIVVLRHGGEKIWTM